MLEETFESPAYPSMVTTPRTSAEPADLVTLLRRRLDEESEHVAYVLLGDGERESDRMTYGGIDARARMIGARLQKMALEGERALLLYPSGLEFIAAFFGCLYAATIAVPAYPPRRREADSRFLSILADARPAAILTTAGIRARIAKVASTIPGLEKLTWLETDTMELGEGEAWREPEIDADTLAFLQYTSGSTAAPKGVMVSHGNLLHNEELIRCAFDQSASSTVVGWLPLFHDMGLIGNVLQPLYTGGRSILMSPMAFLQKPLRWLQAISRYRADTSGGPNFAYDLCVRRIAPEMRRKLDLSCWKVAFNGAEPIRPATLERFAEAFEPSGFERRSFLPCYGLAEATLLVSGRRESRPPSVVRVSAEHLEQGRLVVGRGGAERIRELVSSGRPRGELDVRIVDPDTALPCQAGRIGEVWVSGRSVAQGYWQRPEPTERTFRARLAGGGDAAYLRTGDLGALEGGELFITGRLKDLIIVRGRNHHPQDLELTAQESHAALRPGGGAAFAVETPEEERLVMVHELERRAEADPRSVAERVRQAIAEAHQIDLHELVLIRPGTLPKTSSGKVRRGECRRRYLESELKVVAAAELAAAAPAEARIDLDRDELLALAPVERRGALRAFLANRIARAARTASSDIDGGRPVSAFGLDSLKALELLHEIEEGFGVALSAAQVLGRATLEDLENEVLAQLADPRPAAPAPIAAGAGSSPQAPLSYGQKALWFLHRLDPDSAAYHLAAAVRLDPKCDPAALRRALQLVAERHPALRTTFAERRGEPIQTILPHARIDWQVRDASGWDETELRRRLSDAALAPFDPEAAPPWRVHLFEPSPERRVLLLALHHIIGDFWSLSLLVRELSALYEAERGRPGSGAALFEPLELTFADFVSWEERHLAGEPGERLWRYWSRTLSGDLPWLDLLTDRPRPPVQKFDGALRQVRLGRELSGKIRALARELGVTEYVTLLAAYLTLLHRFTGQNDLVVGTPASGRSVPGLEALVGYFVNPVAIRADFSDQPGFTEFVFRVARSVVEAIDHQAYPFALLAERLQPQRQASRSPIFQSLFAYHTPPPGAPSELAALALHTPHTPCRLGELTVESIGLETRFSRFDLSLTMAEVDGELHAACEYSTHLFEASTIDRLLDSLTTLLTDVVSSPERRLADLAILSRRERVRLSELDKETAAPVPRGCVHEQIVAAARRSPTAVAVTSEGESLSYGELVARADSLARRLRGLGVGTESLVGVCLEPSLELPVTLLAIWMAGGAYVPLDPAYPAERLAWMLEDSRLALVVTRERQAESLPPHDAGLLVLDREPASGAGTAPDVALTGALPENLAYVIYTSGSTGRPKGVQIPHGTLANFLASMAREPGMSENDVVASVTTLSFDIAALELFLPLLTGARVDLVPRRVATDGRRLADHLEKVGATVLQATPATWKLLLAAGWQGSDRLAALCGGEALSRDLAARLEARCAALWNLYGPTETTVWSTLERVSNVDSAGPSVAIGRPIANTRIHLVDPYLRQVPAGTPGELLIGGAGLARGYLRRPALAAGRFVPDPFGGAGARLYRTGDLARRRADDTLEYLGRIDHQVKVRGFRIELGEIEETLRRHPVVSEAVVTAPEADSGERRLVAYVVAAGEPRPTVAELRGFLADRLPASMVPSAFVFLAALPTTPNGKIDRRRLPQPAGARPELAAAYVAPADPVEEVLAAIWEEVLDVDRVGTRDDFFELGGHSLKAAQVVSRVREAFGQELDLRQFFRSPTVAGLAARIGREQREKEAPSSPITAVERPGAFPLASAQERLFSFVELHPESSAYNMPAAIRIEGPLDFWALVHSLREIVRRHEVLRSVFRRADGEPVQEADPEAALCVRRMDLSFLAEDQREPVAARLGAQVARRAFDPASAPLLRAKIFHLDSELHVLYVVAHHLVADGGSLGIFWRELMSSYRALATGEPSPLPDLAVQYADYAFWQRGGEEAGPAAAAIAYWQDRLAGASVVELPADRPRPAVESLDGAWQRRAVAGSLASDLEAFCRRRSVTAFMALLAAFQTLLARYTGQADVTVGVPFSLRDRRELEGLIGFFVNTLPLRTDFSTAPGFQGLVERVREGILAAHEHRRLPQEVLSEQVGEAARFEVTFAELDELPEAETAGIRFVPQVIENGAAKFDLSLFASLAGGRLEAVAEYRTELFEAATVARLLGHLERLLGAAVAAPERPVTELPLLTDGEHGEILAASAEHEVPYPAAAGVHRMFEAQAGRRPHAVAVVDAERSLSYGELNHRANQLAYELRRRGVGADVPVGVLVERSLDLVVAVLGTLKAGGAYVPIDPAYPKDRIAYVLDHAGAPVTLTQASFLERASASPGEVIVLDAARPSPRREDTANPPSGVGAANLAYVIFTSGSTGRPKGVAVAHGGLVQLVTWHHWEYAVTSADRATQLAGLGFDAAVWEIWTYLTAGATLCLTPADVVASPPALVEWLARQRIDLTFLPTPLAEAVLAEETPPGMALRALLTGGDRLRRGPGRELPFALVNHYGPTESTVVATFGEVTAGEGAPIGPPPIGRAITNTGVYLFDRGLELVPAGVPGELVIAGGGLARGYFGRPGATAERFVPHPFGAPGSRLYKTGDLARRRAMAGELEFLGRIDHQVKIRGFRIELGEIESALGRHPGVAQPVVAAREMGEHRALVAYFVPSRGEAPGEVELRRFLQDRLPGYMLPSTFVRLEALPVTAHGKIDREALPAPPAQRSAEAPGYVAPRSALEEELAEIWAGVLGIERVGAHDDFFALGGHSLHVTTIVTRIREDFGVELSPRSLFETPTVAGVAVALGRAMVAQAETAALSEALTGVESLAASQETSNREI